MSPPPLNPTFHAIIVGGSVAGLTLAHIFERAGIEYTLLEARDTISPQLGASIVIMPNGARILDQMGLYDVLKDSIMTPMTTAYNRRENGELVGSNEWPKLIEERLGYICGICERKEFLRSMYNQLKDKSSIQLNKKVISINHNPDSITVNCADGSSFTGDLVIGADGIHSKTRTEMQRYAKKTGPPGIMDIDENCITVEYACLFGISSPIDSLPIGSSHTTHSLDHSSLLFTGPSHHPQFFFFYRLPSPLTLTYHTSQSPSPSPSSTSTSSSTTTSPPPSSNRHRTSPSQTLALLTEHSSFKITPSITLGDLYSTATKTDSFLLEEANHEIWTWRRMVCVGDAIHKMTPNLGQGGNQAIESCAVLGNCLVELLGRSNFTTTASATASSDGEVIENRGKVGAEELGTAMRKYQDLRKERSKKFVQLSGLITRSDALAELKHVLRLLYMPPFSGEILADVQTEMYHTAPVIDFLPLPKRVERNKIWEMGMKRMRKGQDVPRAKL